MPFSFFLKETKMSFENGRPIKNLLYAVTHPLVAAREKPILFIGLVAPAVYFLGVLQGWWPNVVANLFR